jgi:hypothetical protein
VSFAHTSGQAAGGAVAFAVPSQTLDLGDAAAAGAAATAIRSDAQFAFTSPGAGYPVSVTFAAKADGVATTPARSDHGHDIPVFQRVRKTADETVNNSNVMQNDDELLLAIAANEVWAFDLVLFYASATATPDGKYQITGPAGSTLRYHVAEEEEGTAIGFAGGIYTSTGAVVTAADSTATTWVHFKGHIVNGANAGNLQLTWAQLNATVENTKILANSYLLAYHLN